MSADDDRSFGADARVIDIVGRCDLPEQAAFRIAAWAQRYELAGLLVSGTDLREDNTIYQRVQATMNAMFMLVGSAGASPSGHH